MSMVELKGWVGYVMGRATEVGSQKALRWNEKCRVGVFPGGTERLGRRRLKEQAREGKEWEGNGFRPGGTRDHDNG